MSPDTDWTLICALLALIALLLLARDTHKYRMRDRHWLRDMYRQGFRQRRPRDPHHTTIRRNTQDDWECSVGRVRTP